MKNVTTATTFNIPTTRAQYLTNLGNFSRNHLIVVVAMSQPPILAFTPGVERAVLCDARAV